MTTVRRFAFAPISASVPAPARRLALAAVALAALGAGEARSEVFETLEALDGPEFRELAENLAAATHYKAIAPAEPLGLLGFDLGLELSATELEEDLLDRASDGDYGGSGSLLLPRLHLHKGLPFKLDVGGFIGAIPGTDLTVLGVELRYAILEGDVAVPALAVRGSYSRMGGTDELDLDSLGLELTVSKGFLMLTPYAGAGIVSSEATPRGVDSLDEESFEQRKLFVGLNVNLVSLNLTFEADRTDDYTTLSAKLGLRF